jgi:hypothetical protein
MRDKRRIWLNGKRGSQSAFGAKGDLFAAGGDAASSFFREPFPGDAGQRNILRGDGYFGIDMGLSKRWLMPWSEHHSIQLRWEVFNITNSNRFDAQSSLNAIDTYGSQMGNYTRLYTLDPS